VTQDCIFCRIIAGEVPAETVYQDERVIAIRDIAPVAPTHILIMPRAHIESPAQAEETLIGHMTHVAAELAQREGISTSGYRLVINWGADSGQEVSHLHLHLLGGKALGIMG